MCIHVLCGHILAVALRYHFYEFALNCETGRAITMQQGKHFESECFYEIKKVHTSSVTFASSFLRIITFSDASDQRLTTLAQKTSSMDDFKVRNCEHVDSIDFGRVHVIYIYVPGTWASATRRHGMRLYNFVRSAHRDRVGLIIDAESKGYEGQ